MTNNNDAVINAIANLLPYAVTAILALITWLSSVAAQYTKAKKNEVETRIGASNWDLLVNYGRLAVKTAEQLGITGQIEDTGAAKKAHVEEMIQQFLDQRGLKVSVLDLEGIIESAVRDGVHKDWDSGTISGSVTTLLPGPFVQATPIVADVTPVVSTGVPTVEPTQP